MGRGSARLAAAFWMAAEWQSARSLDELGREVCTGLRRLIPGDGAAWNEVDLQGRTIRILASPADYVPGDEQALAELIHENPLVENRARSLGAARTFSDFVGVREFHRRQIYRDVFGPAGVEDQLGAFFGVGPDTVVGVACNRGARTFTSGDRTLLNALLPHLEHSYQTVVERGEAKARLAALERGLELTGQGIAILHPDGGVTAASRETERLLRVWFPAEPPQPGTYTRDHTSLRVRRVDGNPPLLLLDQHRQGPDSTNTGKAPTPNAPAPLASPAKKPPSSPSPAEDSPTTRSPPNSPSAHAPSTNTSNTPTANSAPTTAPKQQHASSTPTPNRRHDHDEQT